MSLQPHQERVAEKADLDDKIEKLKGFMGSPVFTSAVTIPEQMRLQRQLDVMQDYSNILGWRIGAFGTLG